jgi:hypothetical protein
VLVAGASTFDQRADQVWQRAGQGEQAVNVDNAGRVDKHAFGLCIET